ncbi:IS200/IS605 family transposase [Desulfonema ishimotonii]|uniref:IS200/IS605 family transposase n=1 Tax=Desulfonema ishimotonii TaxID=45657 RepID=A0A401G3J6_9BACT|nr:IS200/IS605 family transposase [Desulfonema ishimotonii]GBC63818.1 IS200/IS605 family transposase [Desulfonema ishimotonii]
MKYRIDKGCHSVYCIQFHLIFCVKYRRKVLTKEISERLKELIVEIADKFGVRIIEQETDKDHIHMLFASKPAVTLSKFINSLKSVTSRMIRKEFPEIRQYLWKDKFWSPSYFLASVGQVTLDDVKKYVENQGKK